MYENIVNNIIEIAVIAGQKVLEVYNSGETRYINKSNNTPLTIADTLSNKIIIENLGRIKIDSQNLPIISEEETGIPYEERKVIKKYWLVDPLDGTKEFISRNGEFTINIALIENSYPVLGVIYLPVDDVIYYGINNIGSYKKCDGETRKITVKKVGSDLTVVQSRSHSGKEEEKFYSNFEIKKKTSAGSSLKFCHVAEGKADLYYRSGPTMEWDTGAGQAIVENAGGFVFSNGQRMAYNKASLKNNSFIVSSFKHRLFYEKNSSLASK